MRNVEIMPFDTLCLSPQCIKNRTQLFNSKNPQEQYHYSKNHSFLPIHNSSTILRNFKTDEIQFKAPFEQCLQELNSHYQQMKNKILSMIKEEFQANKKQLTNYYKLSNQKIEFNLLRENLQKNTDETQLYLELINWFNKNSHRNITEYVTQLPQLQLQKYKKRCEKIQNSFENQFGKKDQENQKKPSKIPKYHEDQHLDSENSHPNVDFKNLKQKHMKELLNLPKSIIKQIFIEVNQRHNLFNKYVSQGIKLENKWNSKNPGNLKRQNADRNIKFSFKDPYLIKQAAELFEKSGGLIKKQDFSKEYQQKMQNRQHLRTVINHMVNNTCKHVQNTIQSDLFYRKMMHRQRVRVHTDLKKYKEWMTRSQAQIFIKCLKLFNGVDDTIEIAPYEIYVMFAHISIINIQKRRLKKLPLVDNTSPKDLAKQICYLYYHYEKLEHVQQLLVRRFPQDENVDYQNIKKQFLKVIKQTYSILAEKFKISNRNFQKIIQLQQNFDEQPWNSLSLKYIQYVIFGKISQEQLREISKLMNYFIQNDIITYQNRKNKSILDQNGINPSSAEYNLHIINIDDEDSDENQFNHELIHFQKSSRLDLSILKQQHYQNRKKLIRNCRIVKVQEDSQQTPDSQEIVEGDDE